VAERISLGQERTYSLDDGLVSLAWTLPISETSAGTDWAFL
jgi:hypothetical protein